MESMPEDNDPYFRNDPGDTTELLPIYEFDLKNGFETWKPWRTNDGRILPNSASSFYLIENPFGAGNLIVLSTCFDPATAGNFFGGFGMRVPVDPAVTVNDKTYIEFEFYYPRSAYGKYMRFEIWSTTSGGEGHQANAGTAGTNRTQIYIRSSEMEDANNVNLNSRCGFYNNDTWFKKNLRAAVPVSSGKWEYLNVDIHTEIGAKLSDDLLMIGNIKIARKNLGANNIPDIKNTKSFLQVAPIKGKYNPENGYFMAGVEGTGKAEPDSLRGYHFGIFVDQNNLKPEIHFTAPKWLKDEYPDFQFKTNNENIEWLFPTSAYLDLKNSGKNGEYKIHGHCLAWSSQSPPWMRQIIPENISSTEWNKDGLFYSYGVDANGPFQKVKKETARRVYFNHILCVMRHFMTVDARYDSSEKRGVIPFYSFDVINVEIHESRHSEIIQNNTNEWKTALKNLSWLVAMTDNDYNDIKQHYIYLLFKFAHIAVPNAQMAAKYKEYFNNHGVVPEYMKLDNHDKNGSIDAYVSEAPPILVYNEKNLANYSKTKVVCNMIGEINTAWKSDELYDGRNLIECIGIQGHEVLAQDLVSRTQNSISAFAGLIDNGLLNCICYSEMDIRQSDSAPGGGANAPEILNQKQADTIGYQYALFFKLFEKYKKYIDHVIIWSPFGSSWMGSYVLFDHNQMASQAYYGIMDPDRFIKGHSYLDKYFAGEYNKIVSNNKKS
ncbi:MAG: endo-1,4-beta-xylanase [Treponema sp.]|jgi:GH35 family endo-1,4-beta-xylanase|nr:endo-1,4-beta-xylanase [Treponema sp.]